MLDTTPTYLDGSYTFRFAGVAMSLGWRPYHIVGVGRLSFGSDRKIAGEQHASSTALVGPGAKHDHSVFCLSGRYDLEPPLCGWAEIDFVSPEPPSNLKAHARDMHGFFRFVGVGSYNRLWLVSTGGRIKGFPLETTEVVSGEAVRD